MDKLSSYEFSLVMEYLTEEDARFLYMTGSKKMKVILSHSVSEITSLDSISSTFTTAKTLKRAVVDEDTILPEHLTTIRMLISDLEPAEIVPRLPHGLTSLSIIDWSEDDLMLLPKTLTYLKLVLNILPNSPEDRNFAVFDIDTVDLTLPYLMRSLRIRNVSSLIVTRQGNLINLVIGCDNTLKMLDTTSCMACAVMIVDGKPKPAVIEHKKLATYSPDYDDVSEDSLIYGCRTLSMIICDVQHTYTFPPTLTVVNLGYVNWYASSLLPATVTSLAMKVYRGKPDMKNGHRLVGSYFNAMEENVLNQNRIDHHIKFPPNLLRLDVEYLSGHSDETLLCCMSILPTTLTHIRIKLNIFKDAAASICVIMNQITMCVNVADVYIDEFGVEESSDVSDLDLTGLTKLLSLHAPIDVDVVNMPDSLKYLYCCGVYNECKLDRCKLAFIRVEYMSKHAKQLFVPESHIGITIRKPKKQRRRFKPLPQLVDDPDLESDDRSDSNSDSETD